MCVYIYIYTPTYIYETAVQAYVPICAHYTTGDRKQFPNKGGTRGDKRRFQQTVCDKSLSIYRHTYMRTQQQHFTRFKLGPLCHLNLRIHCQYCIETAFCICCEAFLSGQGVCRRVSTLDCHIRQCHVGGVEGRVGLYNVLRRSTPRFGEACIFLLQLRSRLCCEAHVSVPPRLLGVSDLR